LVETAQRKEARLEQENTRLKKLVGELLLKFKKRRAVGLRRRRSPQVTQRDERLWPRIQQLKVEHPFWGYHPIWASLRVVEQVPVNKKGKSATASSSTLLP